MGNQIATVADRFCRRCHYNLRGLPVRPTITLLMLAAIACAPHLAFSAPTPATQPATWSLVWSDEFDGKALDRTKWTFDTGNGFWTPDRKTWISGWGNNELQFYTDGPDNVIVKDGLLHIRALKQARDKCSYTSARLITKGLFAQTFGRFEFRAKFPVGKGLWPALWLLPADNAYGPWAASGEIDIVEARGHQPDHIVGSTHFGSAWPHDEHFSVPHVLPDKGTIDQFHVYALEWEPSELRWYVDDQLYSHQRKWHSTSRPSTRPAAGKAAEANVYPFPAPFDKPFYILMNLAVGGNFGGNPDDTTLLPAEMVIDYVRVFQKKGG